MVRHGPRHACKEKKAERDAHIELRRRSRLHEHEDTSQQKLLEVLHETKPVETWLEGTDQELQVLLVSTPPMRASRWWLSVGHRRASCTRRSCHKAVRVLDRGRGAQQWPHLDCLDIITCTLLYGGVLEREFPDFIERQLARLVSINVTEQPLQT